MAETSYPFDNQSIAEAQWENFAERGNGVLYGELNNLQVAPASPASMNVVVGTGRAYIKGFWYENSSSLTLAVGSNNSGATRYDRVVLQLDRSTDKISAVVRQGSSTPPALQRDSRYYEISLAKITVANGATQITSNEITDERFSADVGGVIHRWPLVVASSAGRPSSFPVGGLIYENDTGRLYVNTGTYAAPTWTHLSHQRFFYPYVPAGAMEVGDANVPSWTRRVLTNGHPLMAWSFPAGTENYAYAMLTMPSGVVKSAAVRAHVYWTVGTAGTGDVGWRIDVMYSSAGSNLTTAYTTGTAVSSAAPSVNALAITTLNVTAPPDNTNSTDPGRLALVRVARTGTGSYASSADLIGVQFEMLFYDR